ncbi:MAG: hypothetical protein H6945_06815 [Zoogloeaceae bacterium]|nr:hypothetical protein [Rhodocyclaceae bacterium]MCP5235433.1 hypothetical protein [Zoogloeaceae bacterium]
MIDASALRTITGATFRANPDYEIVLLDRLPEGYRKAFAAEAEKDPELHGILWPTSNKGLTPKTLCHQTALMLYALRQPGGLPAFVSNRLGPDCNRIVAELVLDGILEVAAVADAPFVSGAAAQPLLYQDEALELGRGRIADLSREALRYGQLLRADGSGELSSRLYAYNTIPITAAWRERLATPATIETFLGMQAGSPLARRLASNWARLGERDGSEGWIMWRLRDSQPVGAMAAAVRQYKLYVSPRPEALPQAWPDIVDVFAQCRVPAFKIGRDVAGLLRPDKIVAYLDSYEALAVVAARLQPRLTDCPAQGTPFTAGIGEAGLLSWGMDPPAKDRIPGWTLAESWRLWVTNRLAVALRIATASAVDIEPWQFALRRLGIEGVDVGTWAPVQQVWSDRRSA